MRSKLFIILLVVILLGSYYLLGMDYREWHKEQETLASQITEVTQTLGQIPQPPRDLEQQLADAKLRLNAAECSFPTLMNSTQVINAILELADSCHVKAIPLVTKPWSAEIFGEHDYRVFRLNIAVEGSFSQLINFVSKLERGEFETLIIEKLGVTRVTEQPEGETTPEGTIPITANLNLAIYTLAPTSD